MQYLPEERERLEGNENHSRLPRQNSEGGLGKKRNAGNEER